MVVPSGPGAAAATPTPLKAVGRTPRTAASLARVDENTDPAAAAGSTAACAPIAAALDFSDSAPAGGRVVVAANSTSCVGSVPMDMSDTAIDEERECRPREDVLLSCTLPLSSHTPLGMFLDKPHPDSPPVVTAVDPDGPAAAAGVRSGFVLVKFGSTPTWTPAGSDAPPVSMGSMHLSQLIWSAQAAAAAYGGKVVEVTFQAPSA